MDILNGKNSTDPRVYLMRLIPDAPTSNAPKNQALKKAEERIQREDVAKRLIENFFGKRMVIFCDSAQQCEELCLYPITASNKSVENLNYQKFNNGEVDWISTCKALPTDIRLKGCQYAIFTTPSLSQMTKQTLAKLLQEDGLSIFIVCHMASIEEQIAFEAIKPVDPNLVLIYNIPLKEETQPEAVRPGDEKFDRIKTFDLNINSNPATYKFMWNDGFTGVYYTIIYADGQKKEGFHSDENLVRNLNLEFNQQFPSNKLQSIIAHSFEDNDSFETL